jgi:hypothetical protein
LSRPDDASARLSSGSQPSFKESFLAEIRKTKTVFYQTVVAQAQRIEIGSGRVVFAFSSTQRALCDMFEQQRAWLESIAGRITGQPVSVSAVQMPPAAESPGAEGEDAATRKKSALRERALADAGVCAVLDAFSAEIRDVEEI